MITLVIGGARSGKSAWAEQYAVSLANKAEERCYLATGVACDEEMVKRIELHQERRRELFYTVEEPYDLGKRLEKIKNPTKVVLVDCLTTWLGNLSYRASLLSPSKQLLNSDDSLEYFPEIEQFAKVLKQVAFDVVIVSNELGWGIVPAETEVRLFRDRHGRLNQLVASLADQVVLVAAGLPLALKSASEKGCPLKLFRD